MGLKALIAQRDVGIAAINGNRFVSVGDSNGERVSPGDHAALQKGKDCAEKCPDIVDPNHLTVLRELAVSRALFIQQAQKAGIAKRLEDTRRRIVLHAVQDMVQDGLQRPVVPSRLCHTGLIWRCTECQIGNRFVVA